MVSFPVPAWGLDGFPLLRQPPAEVETPILVSVPHYGTHALPHVTATDYSDPGFTTFAFGFADTFAADLYADLHTQGATVVATPLSRMFVDVNRRRDDFEQIDGMVQSRRGVVRTHTMRDVPIFAHPLRPEELEARLQTFYDPYYATLTTMLARLQSTYGHAVLLDSHTGSPRRMHEYQVILGTSHGKTSHRHLVETIAAIFTAHDFVVHQNISGYAGGNIVRTYGRPEQQHVHAIQIEINAAVLMTTSQQEFLAQIRRGEMPDKAEATVARLRACLREILTVLPREVAALHA